MTSSGSAIAWDEGPIRQSERQGSYREAAEKLGGDRFGKITLLREDGTATYHLASVVDDIEFEITHVIRGNDHRPNETLHRELTVALGATPPEYVHHGLILGEDGRKLSKREFGSTVASLRDAGIPAEAVRRYLDELGIPKHDVHYDIPRVRRLAIEAIAAMSDEDLAAAAAAPVELVPALRGARDLNEAREYARQVLEPEPVSLGEEARPTLERFKELSANGAGAKDIVRELKAVGGDLRVASTRPDRPRARARALRDRRRTAPRRDTEADRCSSITPPPASSTTCRRLPARSACTSAARPSTSGSTSATRGRSSSRCGSSAGSSTRATTSRWSRTSRTSTTRSTRPRRVAAPSSPRRRPSGTSTTRATSASGVPTTSRRRRSRSTRSSR